MNEATQGNIIGSIQKEYQLKARCPGFKKVLNDFFTKKSSGQKNCFEKYVFDFFVELLANFCYD